MSDKTLGLDLGDDAVKAVLAVRGIKGGFRITDAAHIPVEPDSGLSGALARLFENSNFRDCACVTAVPVQSLSFRNVTLPFRDEKKIRQVIAYELEPLIHYAIDEAILDYVIVRQDSRSDIFAAVAPRTFVRERTALLAGHVRKIRQMDVEGASPAGVLSERKAVPGGAMLLDVGASHSIAVFINDGRIFQVRPFPFGGRQITRTIADDLNIPLMEAEEKKRKNEIGRAEAAVAALTAKFCSDLKNTIEFMTLQGRLLQEPSRLYLTGGGALYGPLQNALSGHLSIAVEPLDLLSGGDITVDQAAKYQWNPLVMNQALALAVGRYRKGAGFNIKERDSRVKAAYGQLKSTLRWAAAVVLSFLILGGAGAYLDYRYNQQRLNLLKGEINALFKTYSPETTRVVDPVAQLRGKINEARKASLGTGDARGGATVLAILKDISSLAPASTELLMTSFAIEKDMLLLKGQAKNFDAVDTLKKEYMKSKYFQAVAIGGTNLMKQGDKVEFDMRITIKK